MNQDDNQKEPEGSLKQDDNEKEPQGSQKPQEIQQKDEGEKQPQGPQKPEEIQQKDECEKQPQGPQELKIQQKDEGEKQPQGPGAQMPDLSSKEKMLSWLVSSLVGTGHSGGGSGTGEPSVVEQALKRPGTVDFQQLLAGLAKSPEAVQEPPTPNPSLPPTQQSAPSTPLTQPVPQAAAPAQAVQAAAPPAPVACKSEPPSESADQDCYRL